MFKKDIKMANYDSIEFSDPIQKRKKSKSKSQGRPLNEEHDDKNMIKFKPNEPVNRILKNMLGQIIISFFDDQNTYLFDWQLLI